MACTTYDCYDEYGITKAPFSSLFFSKKHPPFQTIAKVNYINLPRKLT